MSIQTKKFIYLSVPRTASRWTKQVIQEHCKRFPHDWGKLQELTAPAFKLSPNGKRSGHAVPYTRFDDKIRDPRFDKGKFTFCHIRHPMSWYRSHYMSRAGVTKGTSPQKWSKWKGKKSKHAGDFEPTTHFDQTCGDDNFSKYIESVIKYRKSTPCNHRYGGFCSTVMEHYFTHCCDFVGKYENLEEDLITAFNMAEAMPYGEEKSIPEYWEALDIVNHTQPRNNYSQKELPVEHYYENALYTQQQAEQIMELDKEYVLKYDYDYVMKELVK